MNEPRNEKQLVDRIVKAVKKEYPQSWVLKVHGGGYQRSGIPDILICHKGRLFGFEVKHQKTGETEEHARERATALQLKEIKDIQTAGGIADVVLSVDHVLDLLSLI